MRVIPRSALTDPLPNPQPWERRSGDVVLHHPRIGQIIHTIVCRDDGTPLYDDYLQHEAVGVIVVPVSIQEPRRTCFVLIDRPVFQEGVGQTYPGLDYATLGGLSLEVPRGSFMPGETTEQAVRRVAEQKTGCAVLDVGALGRLNPNTRFNPQKHYVFRAAVDQSVAGAHPLALDVKIASTIWLTADEIKGMIRDGTVFCGMTQAALLQDSLCSDAWG